MEHDDPTVVVIASVAADADTHDLADAAPGKGAKVDLFVCGLPLSEHASDCELCAPSGNHLAGDGSPSNFNHAVAIMIRAKQARRSAGLLLLGSTLAVFCAVRLVALALADTDDGGVSCPDLANASGLAICVQMLLSRAWQRLLTMCSAGASDGSQHHSNHAAGDALLTPYNGDEGVGEEGGGKEHTTLIGGNRYYHDPGNVSSTASSCGEYLGSAWREFSDSSAGVHVGQVCAGVGRLCVLYSIRV